MLFIFIDFIDFLVLKGCINITDQVIYAIADCCKHLEALGIEHCTMVSDEALAYIPPSLHKLTFLSADSCGFIGNTTCWALAAHLKTIKDLYLNNCVYITDESIDILTSHCDKVSYSFEFITFYFDPLSFLSLFMSVLKNVPSLMLESSISLTVVSFW
jgi:hypothetical protein